MSQQPGYTKGGKLKARAGRMWKRLDKSKIDPGVVRAAVKKLGLPDHGSDEDRAQRVIAAMSERSSKELLLCSTCQADSTEEFDACPICGDAGFEEPGAEDAEPAATVKAKPATTKAKPAAKATKAKPVAKAKKPAKPSAAKAKPAKPAKATKAKPAAAKAKPAAAKAKPAAAKAKLAKTKPAAAKAKPAAAKAKPASVNESVDLDRFTEADLDQQLERYQRAAAETEGHLQQASLSMWDAGASLYAIWTSELWRLRRSSDGGERYTTFRRFVKEEVGVSHAHAYRLMRLPMKFNRDQVEQIGSAKLWVVVGAAEQHHDHLLERAKADDCSVKDLKEEARKLSAASDPEDPAPAARDKRDRMGMAFVPGRQEVQLLKRGGDARARKLRDDPWGEVRLEDSKFVQRYHLVQDVDGGLTLIIETTRE